jgi:mono/diheme cytochrome c family protein
MNRLSRLLMIIAVLASPIVGACDDSDSRHPVDDAKAAGKTVADFPELAVDVFKQMDGEIELSSDEIKGRNSWLLWSAGNQLFWDRMAREGYGIVDLLKTLDSRRRPRRFAEMGLINEPGFRTAPKPDQFGLWLDEPETGAEAGVDARIYGRSSGVIGFRIFPNPDFDDAARRHWNADRYYNDPSYYTDPKLVRPYRIGVTCASCHVAFNPLHPAADPEHPGWENLSSAIANQYIREGKAFAIERPGSFLWEMLNAQPPGTSDTSRPATDHINNPNAINALFLLGARFGVASDERMAGGSADWPGEKVRPVPHFLKDGADSVGVAGAMMRVYVNEGLYSQEWLKDHDLLLGLHPQKPFPIASAFRNSVYWQATYARTANVAKFFARLEPMHLEDAPGGKAYITKDRDVMKRGRTAFADRCAACHSSKQPPAGIDPRSDAGRAWFRRSVMRPDFRDDNFLSNEKRYPVTLIKTNACRAVATNAARGHIWDNFSSETYKTLPAVGTIETYDPGHPGKPFLFEAPAGGPGYYRPPSLIAIWSSAPFLHNHSVGIFTGDPSVAGRMRAFSDAIEKLLWPEKRLGTASIWRTTQTSYLRIPEGYVPTALRPLVRDGYLSIGPIPKGMPVNLLANVNPTLPNLARLIAAIEPALLQMAKTKQTFSDLLEQGPSDSPAARLIDALMSASNCPDLIEDRGHTFGADLSDDDKRALIEFLKTL